MRAGEPAAYSRQRRPRRGEERHRLARLQRPAAAVEEARDRVHLRIELAAVVDDVGVFELDDVRRAAARTRNRRPARAASSGAISICGTRTNRRIRRARPRTRCSRPARRVDPDEAREEAREVGVIERREPLAREVLAALDVEETPRKREAVNREAESPERGEGEEGRRRFARSQANLSRARRSRSTSRPRRGRAPA